MQRRDAGHVRDDVQCGQSHRIHSIVGLIAPASRSDCEYPRFIDDRKDLLISWPVLEIDVLEGRWTQPLLAFPLSHEKDGLMLLGLEWRIPAVNDLYGGASIGADTER